MKDPCVHCQELGHRSFSCSKRPDILGVRSKEGLDQIPLPPMTLEKVKRMISPKHTIDDRRPASELRGERRLTQEEFLKVKDLQNKEKAGTAIAELLGADLQQVNYAILSKEYAQYLASYLRP